RGAAITPQRLKLWPCRPKRSTACSTAASATTVCSSDGLRKAGGKAGPPGGPRFNRSSAIRSSGACATPSACTPKRPGRRAAAPGPADEEANPRMLTLACSGRLPGDLAQLGLHQVQQVLDGGDVLQLVGGQDHAKTVLDLHDQRHQVHRVQ